MRPKHRAFVAAYLATLNATQAAITAGYSKRSARVTGGRLLLNAAIGAAVAAGKSRQLQAADLDAGRVLEELRRLALMDPRGVFDERGALRPVTEWTPEQAACLSSFEVIIKNAQAGDGKTDTIHRVKFWDKTKALEMLAKHFALLVERVEHSGGITVSWLPAHASPGEVVEASTLPALPPAGDGATE